MKKILQFVTLRRLVLFLLGITLFCIAATYFANRRINHVTAGNIYDSLDSLPARKVGLLLGTGKYLESGTLNPYYRNRISAATALFKANKIEYLLISGDNSRVNYNEPEMMRDDLIKSGVDSARIYLDYAGFRTFDSMIRAREIFGLKRMTVISQQFHNQRAVFIAKKLGMDAIAFNAKDVSRKFGWVTQLREKLARVKVFLDFWFNAKPKFLGERISIPRS